MSINEEYDSRCKKIGSNLIHETAIIEENVTIGDNNFIGPYCLITGNTIVGDNNRFEAYVSVGTPAEHRDYFKSSSGSVIIGNGNIIREFVTINGSTKNVTKVEDNITLLRGSHLGHDAIIESNVNISCNAMVGGHTYIMKGSNLGLNVLVHQFQIIGSFSMIGMGSVVTKKIKIEPGFTWVGNPVSKLKTNEIGLERQNVTDEILKSETQRFYELSKTITHS
tara:strand:+ start:122 stop:790 length:669 start_codon:yes stop_codon:yes gene_type:complete